MIRVLFIFALCWLIVATLLVLSRPSSPDGEWQLSMRDGYWWREYEDQDTPIKNLGKLKRISAYNLGKVSIQTTSGDYTVRYDGRTGDIDGLFASDGEDITRHYTTGPNLPFHLLLHVAGIISGTIAVQWFRHNHTNPDL